MLDKEYKREKRGMERRWERREGEEGRGGKEGEGEEECFTRNSILGAGEMAL